MADFPSFDRFSLAVHGHEPFAWQQRLSERVIASGWPDCIGVPTGLGKTSCIDIAVHALAAEASISPDQRHQPTRIWYVVNRRLLVDEGAARAEMIAGLLQKAITSPELIGSDDEIHRDAEAIDTLRIVAEALASRTTLGNLDGPLHASRLHGGYSNSKLPLSPAQPSVLCATVPMFGSRLLFRGYGTGRYTRSVEAALAGTDSLVLLDEAHLARPLKLTIERLSQADSGTSTVVDGQRSTSALVQMTATADHEGERFDLIDADSEGDSEAAQTLRKRLSAAKRGVMVGVPHKKLVDELAEQAANLLAEAHRPIAVAVFVNSPTTAVSLKPKLDAACRRLKAHAEIEVLTGRMRPFDAQQVRKGLLEGDSSVRSGRSRSDLPAHRVIITTQTLEVGADLDFDAMVTQNAGRRALIQRFGRLNRFGDMSGYDETAKAVIVHPEGGKPDLLYGDEPGDLFSDLVGQGPFELSPGAISGVIGEPQDEGPYVPQLLPNHLDEYAKTSNEIIGLPPVELFIDGVSDFDRPTVQVIWRGYLPLSDESGPVALVPPLAEPEAVDVSLGDFRRYIAGPRGSDVAIGRITSDRLSVERVGVTTVRPGDQLVLTLDAGGYDNTVGWDPSAPGPVDDLSWTGGRLVLAPDAVEALLRTGGTAEDVIDIAQSAAVLLSVEPDSPRSPSAVLEALSAEAGETDLPDAWVDLLASAASEERVGTDEGDSVWEPAREFAEAFVQLVRHSLPDGLRDDLSLRWVALGPSRGVWLAEPPRNRRFTWSGPGADDLDLLSAVGGPVSPGEVDRGHLNTHLRVTGERARSFAREVGLSEDMQMAVYNAGRLHDLGKADPRFQLWVERGEGPLRAKSATGSTDWERSRVASGWPRGGRHETLSVRAALALAAESDDAQLLMPDPDLVLHLVASHHGRGRPGLPSCDDAEGARFVLDTGALGFGGANVEVDGNLGRIDWDQPDRFTVLNKRYGRRGLALLEAILRQADWAESARVAQSGSENAAAKRLPTGEDVE